MNTQKLKSWLGFFLLSLASFQSMTVLAGAEKGNGADDETYGGTSWFLGQDKVIRYCYISTANFLSSNLPQDRLVIESTLKDAFATWHDYIAAKRINATRIQNGQEDLTLPLRSQLVECDGREDLKFWLGAQDGENGAVAQAKKRYENPAGLVSQGTYDPIAGWTRGGFVWIANPNTVDTLFPNWQRTLNGKYLALKGIFMHEIGHVLGCGHLSGTIMDENLVAELKSFQNAERRLDRVDGDRELVVCENCGFSVTGHVGADPSGGMSPDAVFKFFTGRFTSGANVTGKIRMEGTSSRATLILADSAGSFNFEVTLSQPSPSIGFGSSSAHPFKAVRTPNYVQIRKAMESTFGGVYLGSVLTSSADRVNVVLTRNSSGPNPESLTLSYFDSSGKIQEVLRAFPE